MGFLDNFRGPGSILCVWHTSAARFAHDYRGFPSWIAVENGGLVSVTSSMSTIFDNSRDAFCAFSTSRASIVENVAPSRLRSKSAIFFPIIVL